MSFQEQLPTKIEAHILQAISEVMKEKTKVPNQKPF